MPYKDPYEKTHKLIENVSSFANYINVTGKSYVVTNAKKLLDGNDRKLPRWFTIVFPAMLEQAERVDLHLNLPRELKALVSSFNVGR